MNTPNKFVIISQQRSGSHMLMNLLNAHPDIHCNSDLQTADIRERGEEWALREGFSVPAAVGSPLWVGFLVKFKHDMHALLATLPDLKILLIRRKNRLATLLSKKVAKEFGCYEKKEANVTLDNAREVRAQMPAVHITPSEAEKFFETWSAKEEEVLKTLKDSDITVLNYEEVLEDKKTHIDQIFEDFGLPLVPANHTSGRGAQKLDPRPLHEAIENYAELRDYFFGTRWAEFFEYEPSRSLAAEM